MDRNTILGLVLIGSILAVFTIFNRPSEEELKKQEERDKKEIQIAKDKKDSEATKKAGKDVNQKVKEATQATFVAKRDANDSIVKNAKNQVVFINTTTGKDSIFAEGTAPEIKKQEVIVAIPAETIRLENEKLIIDFSTQGGQIEAVYLKDYQTYYNFEKAREVNKKDPRIIAPLNLFRKGDAKNQLVLYTTKGLVKTSNFIFDVKSKTENQIIFSHDFGNGEIVEYKYEFNKDAFDLDYTINLSGFDQNSTYQNAKFNWEVAYRKTERLFSEQRRVSTICYTQKNDGFSYLSEVGDDYVKLEDDITWLAYKQSYFSSILRPRDGFEKKCSSLKVNDYEEDEAKHSTHLKDYSSYLSLPTKKIDGQVSMNWYFGPNDKEILAAYDAGYDDVLNYGWGIFRWINLYAVQPLFNLLTSTGMGLGLAILLLTIVLKLVLMPIQWKMYVSSAKMRILKPEIDELNKKFPEKSDAMKKQMEMMTLYRESGASPLSGCVPMLIQMPILLAVFRFFPASFEIRQKGFLWATDLSSYDSILDLGVNIWPYGDHVSLFTLLMAGTTLLYTHLNSSNVQQPTQPGMPNMKVIMYIFPIMMIFFFNNYAAGLSYYYFISTLMSIVLMVMIKKFFVDEDKLKLKMANRKASKSSGDVKVKKKSKFQERLEQMQKIQQEQKRNKK